MQNCTTILGIIDMRQRGISYDDCRSRYHIGCSTISLYSLWCVYFESRRTVRCRYRLFFFLIHDNRMLAERAFYCFMR